MQCSGENHCAFLIVLNPFYACAHIYISIWCFVNKECLLSFVQGKSLAPIPEDEAEFEEEDDESLNEVNQEGNEVEDENENVEHYENRDDAAVENNERSSFENVSLTDEKLPSGDQITQPSDQQSAGWRTIPKPKGHSHLDYSRWDSVQIDSSEDEDDSDDEDDDDDPQPQYRFRVKTVGVKAVK